MNGVPVLIYHEIVEQNNNNQDSYAISRRLFEKQIEYLSVNSFQVITLKQLLEANGNRYGFTEKTIVLTFDDGHESDYKIAFPVLKKYGFKAEIFITTNNIGKECCLKKEQIIDLSRNGFPVQSHMIDHVFFSDLRTEEERKYQIGRSKQILEEIIKDKVSLISLPGGRYDRTAEIIARRFNYAGICTSVPGLNNPLNPYFIERIAIKSDFPMDLFELIVHQDKRFYDKLKLKYRVLSEIKSILGNKIYHTIWNILFRRSK